jgi:iron(III) transport system ATP-binding protein
VDIKGELKINVPVKSSYTGPAKLSARPEQLFFSDSGMPGTVQFSTFLGDYVEYEVQLDDGQNLVVNEYTKDTTEVYEAGEKVFLRFDPQRINVYAAESEEVITC